MVRLRGPVVPACRLGAGRWPPALLGQLSLGGAWVGEGGKGPKKYSCFLGPDSLSLPVISLAVGGS